VKKTSLTHRLYAHQGAFLSLPEASYPLDGPPWINLELIHREARIIAEEIRGAAELGFHGFVLETGVEDFCSHDWMGHPQAIARAARAEAWGKVFRGFTDLAHGLGMSFHVQSFELAPDAWVAPRLNRGNIREYLQRRYERFFALTGADGVIVIPSETHPRGGCVPHPLWGEGEDLGQMVADYDAAVRGHCGRELRFSVWLAAKNPEEFGQAARLWPADVPVCLWHTEGDFWSGVGLNPVLPVAARTHRPSLLIDAYGQYHGWGRFLHFDRSWPGHIARAAELGTGEAILWGSWTPANCQPDEAPGWLTPPGRTRWAGVYPEAGLWQGNHLAGQIKLRYLCALLDGDAPDEALQKAAAGCGLGPGDVGRLGAARAAVENLTAEMTLHGRDELYPFLDTWATIFQEPRKTWAWVLAREGRAAVRATVSRIRESADALRRAMDGVEDSRLAGAAELCLLYHESIAAVREAACADPAFARCDPASYDATLLRPACAALREVLRRWEKFPEDGKMWFMSEFDSPRQDVRAHWLRKCSLRTYLDRLESGDVPHITGEPFRFANFRG
jgi:hypothetical protein